MKIKIVDEICNYQENQKNHIMRRPLCRYPKQVIFSRPDGTRYLGRRWSDLHASNINHDYYLGGGHECYPCFEEKDKKGQSDPIYKLLPTSVI